jgi:hypothetical protein
MKITTTLALAFVTLTSCRTADTAVDYNTLGASKAVKNSVEFGCTQHMAHKGLIMNMDLVTFADGTYALRKFRNGVWRHRGRVFQRPGEQP